MADALTPTTPSTADTTGQGTTTRYPPYRASWIDLLTSAVERAPIPPWAVYALAWAAIYLLYSGIKWYDGAYPFPELSIYHFVFTAMPVYILASMHALDRVSSRALERFRPVLSEPSAFQQLHYRLTTLPAIPVIIITLWAVVAVLLPTNQWSRPEMDVLKLDTSSLSSVMETFISFFGSTLPLLYVYHTFHQLRVVNTIYTHHTHVNLLKLKPLYAFASLTALTAALPIIPLYFETSTVPTSIYSERESSLVLLWAVFIVLGLITFILPLWNAHALLEKAKESEQTTLTERTQTLLSQVHSSADNRDFADAAPSTSMKNLLDSLVTERTLLDKISTWPWSPETPRLLASALVLPIVLLVVAQIVRRIIGP